MARPVKSKAHLARIDREHRRKVNNPKEPGALDDGKNKKLVDVAGSDFLRFMSAYFDFRAEARRSSRGLRKKH